MSNTCADWDSQSSFPEDVFLGASLAEYTSLFLFIVGPRGQFGFEKPEA